MVRKQFYLQPQQEAELKELAEQRQTTEAELIREAIDAFLNKPTILDHDNLPLRESAWQEMLAYVTEREKNAEPGEPYKWKREDGYDDERYRRAWNISPDTDEESV